MSIPYRTIAVAAIAILVALGWFYFKPQLAPVGEHMPAKVAPQVKIIPKIDLKISKVKVYASIAKAKLKLPAAELANPDIHVIESNRIAPDLHPQTVTTLIDAAIGETHTLVRREPYPWLSAEQTGEIRLSYGIKRAIPISRLNIREDLVQIKGIHAGLAGSLDSDGEYFYGASLAYRW